MERFKICVKEARIQEACSLQLDVPTRWNSTYLMLESALKFQKAFKRLAERDVDFVLMQGGLPMNDDWENARCFVKFLKIFYDVTKKVSGSTFGTSSQYFHEHCLIMNTLKTWIGSNDQLLGSMAEKMKVKYDKYWGNIKNMNMMMFVAVILDPRYKLRFLEWSFQKLYGYDDAKFLCEKVKGILNSMFESYRLFYDADQLNNPSSGQGNFDFSTVNNSSFAMEFEKDVSLGESMSTNEVDLYLMVSLEKNTGNFDILNWWKVNSTKFSTLGQIARDVLAMPMSTVASESAFSIGGRVLNSYRSSLTPKTVEALICSQNLVALNPNFI